MKRSDESRLRGFVPRTWIYLGIIALVIVAFFLGNAIVGYLASITPPEEGIITLDLTMQAGDFLPRDVVIEVSFENQTSSITLGEFLEKSGSGLIPEEGSFYSSEISLSGSGEGYGIRGKKTSYPDVSLQFNLSVYELVINKTPYNVTDTIVTLINETVEVFNETLNTTVNQTINTSETVEENRTLYNITEELVFLESGIFNASCSFESPYSTIAGDLIEHENATYRVSLVPGSVRSGNNTLDDSYVFLEMRGDVVLIETNYSETIEGYGEDFTGDNETFSLNLQELGIETPNVSGAYTVITRVIHNDSILEETSKKITLTEGIDETCIDNDGDGFDTCEPDMDCDDIDPGVNPGAGEVCNDGKDNNCDGLTDLEDPGCEECKDKDGDGYDTCEEPMDCDDTNPFIHPGAKDVCGNLIDEDCDGYDKLCPVSLSETIKSKNIKYVNREARNEILRRGQARIIIKLRDVSKKSEIVERITPKREVKNFISTVVSEKEIVSLLNRFTGDEIELIQIDHPIELVLDDAVNQTGVWEAWDLGVTGKNQAVCVIDSGIDYNHENLSGNYIGGYDFVNNDNDPMDDYGHGTYVSGIITGIARDSKILAVKVFGNDGVGYESDILAGIDYCVNNRDTYNISVMLMSFGGWIYNTSCYCDSNIIANESNFAVSQGIFAVAASGNDGEPYLKAPACGTSVTSVGAVDKNDNVSDFSNIEPLLDLLAPGVEVQSTKLGGGFEAKNGTSASAAVVAGIASLILENESLAPLDLQQRLRSTGFLITHNNTNYPRIDAYSALINNITNTPSEQVGKQCEGEWEEYEPQFPCCLKDYPPYPDSNCGGSELEGLCINAYCDMGCGCECEDDGDCQVCVGGASNQYYGYAICTDDCDMSEWDCYCDYGTPYCAVGLCGAECDSNDDCGNGTGGWCDTTTDCECDNVTDCTNGCLYIKDSSGNNVAIFDSYGSLDLKGTYSPCPGGICTAPANSFVIKNSGGTTKAFISSSGNLGTPVIPMTFYWQSSCNPGVNAFQVKNSGGTTKAYITDNGVPCLMGWINTNAAI